MLTYIAAFIFYTLAMIGVLMGGFIIYKKTFATIKSENKGMIKVVDSYVIAPKKSLMIIEIKDENFLIAVDSERTTFLTKLNDNKQNPVIERPKQRADYNYNIEADIQQEIQNALRAKDNTCNDNRKVRSDEIQRQFMELYSKNEPEAHNIQPDDISNRKQMIRHLINELNGEKANGSKF